MISLKLGAIIIGAFAAGAFVMSPVPQAIAAVIATDVQCTGCVGTADLAGNAITSAKIKDGEVKTEDIALSAIGSARIKDNDVKAQDLAPDSVGASELQGVSKLIFASCSLSISGDIVGSLPCSVPGATVGDRVIATFDNGSVCGTSPLLHGARVFANNVVSIAGTFKAACGSTVPVSVIVFR